MSNIFDKLSEIGFKVKNYDLYLLALTHPSYNADANTKNVDYERLEFIGDSVLGYVSADLIFKYHSEMAPGEMSKLRSYLVKSSSLATYARNIGLASYIKTGHSVSPEQINNSNRILEDVFEALVGALYLDLGIKEAYRYVKYFLSNDIINVNMDVLTDAKTKLQEEMQAEHREGLRYFLTKQEGPAHNRTFTVNVIYNDVVLGTGVGKTKKAAEEDAARKALEKRSV